MIANNQCVTTKRPALISTDSFKRNKKYANSIGRHRIYSRAGYAVCVLAERNTSMLTKRAQIDVSFSCVCPVIDHKFPHNIVKVAVDPRGETDEILCKQ